MILMVSSSGEGGLLTSGLFLPCRMYFSLLSSGPPIPTAEVGLSRSSDSVSWSANLIGWDPIVFGRGIFAAVFPRLGDFADEPLESLLPPTSLGYPDFDRRVPSDLISRTKTRRTGMHAAMMVVPISAAAQTRSSQALSAGCVRRQQLQIDQRGGKQ